MKNSSEGITWSVLWKQNVQAKEVNSWFSPHVMRRPCRCTKQRQNVAQVLHNNRIKFPKDFFHYCSVHQHGRRDERENRETVRSFGLKMAPNGSFIFVFCAHSFWLLFWMPWFLLKSIVENFVTDLTFGFLYRFWSWRIIRRCLKLTTPWNCWM